MSKARSAVPFRDGAIRAAIAGTVLLFALRVSDGPSWTLLVFFVAAGLGIFAVVLRPGGLIGRAPVVAALDATAVGVLVADTGGSASLFFPLYFVVALGMVWPASGVAGKARARVAGAAAFATIVGSCSLAVVFSEGWDGLLSQRAAFGVGLLALSCMTALWLGDGLRSARDDVEELSASLAAERDHTRKAEARSGAVGPAMGAALGHLSLESALGLVAETARATVGASYAHVTSAKGNPHHSLMLEGSDACPSWWHPAVQRLILESCRESRIVRQQASVHGIECLMAVPLGAPDTEAWGAIVVGGRGFDEEDERALRQLAAAVLPALDRPPDAEGGADVSSGLPHAASFGRLLRREASLGRPRAVLAVDVRTGQTPPGGDLLRRIGGRLKTQKQRVFRFDEDTLLLVTGSEDGVAGRAHAVRRVVAQEMEAAGVRSVTPAVGFVLAGEADPDATVSAALRALEEARSHGNGVVGTPTAPPEVSPPPDADLPSVRGLVRVTAMHDPYLREHAAGVSRVAERLGQVLDLPPGQLRAVTVGGLLHDVGKIGVPDAILRKPGPLNAEEYATIKIHPAIGVEIVSEFPELSSVVPAILHHHERFDGLGYPEGLSAEGIPLVARVVAVADAFDSMIRERPYGRRLAVADALAEIWRNAGTQFDPKVAEALFRAVGEPGGPRTDEIAL